MRVLVSALCLLMALPLAFPAIAASPPPTVLLHIGLEKHFAASQTVLLSSDNAFTIQDAVTNRVLVRGIPGEAYKVSAGPDGLWLARDEPGGDVNAVIQETPITLIAEHSGLAKIARLNGAPQPNAQKVLWSHYRGTLTVSSAGDTALSIVNTVPLEQYLYGVVPAEIGAEAPLEALKAQAVAARTYALKNRGKCAAQGYDLDDTTHCEGYDGWDGETPDTVAAVNSTSGLVLTYRSALIDAPYSTDSGGMTACEAGCPYLQAVLDAPSKAGPDYAADTKYHVWTLLYTVPELQAALAHDDRTAVSTLTSFTLDGFDASGRITTATVTGTDMNTHAVTKTVTGPQLRQILGYDVLRSTRVTLAVLPNGDYFFSGKGWGHGFGMSQEGAIAMASAPYRHSYRDILSHYYIGTTLAPAAAVITPQVSGRGITLPRRGA